MSLAMSADLNLIKAKSDLVGSSNARIYIHTKGSATGQKMNMDFGTKLVGHTHSLRKATWTKLPLHSGS